MQILIKILIFIALFLVLFSLFTFFMSIHPPKIITNIEPSDLGLEYEGITFKSADGIKLSGWLIPNNKTKKTVIVMHGYPADKANLLGIAEFLTKDFNVFLFDFRSFGKSEGSYTTAGYLEKNDIIGAINYLEKEKNLTKIGLYGFSLGGAVALMVNHENVKAIVTDSAYAKLSNIVKHMYRIFFILKYPLAYLTKLYGILFLRINIDDASPVESIKNLEIPILLIHAEKDSQIPVKEAYLLHNANKKAELWIVKNAEHGMTHSVDTGKYEKRVIGFFEQSIK
ncbi:alpha/beta hydrolase [Candidatus Woesearchaeota archaeon]|nr:alpha/beta hydrolase [Candidatus Woesearchaeota archaeon]